MLSLLKGGRIVDPVNERDEIADVWIEDDRIVAAPPGRLADKVHDVSGKIVMAGAIDRMDAYITTLQPMVATFFERR